MACRCAEIRKYEMDIQLLTNAINGELRNIQEKNSRWAKLPELSQDLAKVTFVSNMTKIETRLAAIKQNQNKRVSDALAKRSSELTMIQRKRDQYDAEDTRYHEMMEQRARV